ncbi:MAG: UDP-N-acetylmuramate dehydrogenase, partial [Bacteroidota bacterium]
MIQENISLKDRNTFGIDAQARFFAEVKSVTELQEILQDARWAEVEKMVLGGGSNVLLVGDVSGLVIHMSAVGKKVVEENEDELILEVGAGENWHGLVMHCVAQGWGGIENLSLIPGRMGAAPIQNIGAYGVELKDVFVHLDAVEIASGKLRRFTHTDCAFGYRDSVFKRDLKGRYIITSVALRLTKRNHSLNTGYGAISKELEARGVTSPTIRDISEVVTAIRQSKLPDPAQIGNGGSFFKNPELPLAQYESLKAQHPELPGYVVSDTIMKVPAAWLIDRAGWKGRRFGNYGVHDRQALVLVNFGGAKGQDIYDLSSEIKASVAEKYGVDLEREV